MAESEFPQCQWEDDAGECTNPGRFLMGEETSTSLDWPFFCAEHAQKPEVMEGWPEDYVITWWDTKTNTPIQLSDIEAANEETT